MFRWLRALSLVSTCGLAASVAADGATSRSLLVPEDQCSFLQQRLEVDNKDEGHASMGAAPSMGASHVGPRPKSGTSKTEKNGTPILNTYGLKRLTPPAAELPEEQRKSEPAAAPAAQTEWHAHQEPDAVDPSVVLVKMIDAVTSGKLKGNDCEKNAAAFFTQDAVIDARGPKDADRFKMYPEGLKGVCEYFSKRGDFELHDITSAMYQKGNRIVHTMSYRPGIVGSGEMSSEFLTEYNVHRFNKEKTLLAGFDAFFDSPSRYDELKGQGSKTPPDTPQSRAVNKVFADLAVGKFTGDICKQNAVDLFSKDAVIDLKGPQKDSSYFKQYSAGIDGVCEFLNKTKSDYEPENMQSSMYMRGDELVQFFNFVPKYHGTGGKKASGRIQQYHVWWFSPDMKILGLDSICNKPELFDEIFLQRESEVKQDQDTRVRVMKEEAVKLLEADNLKTQATDEFAHKVAAEIMSKQNAKSEAKKVIATRAATILNVSSVFAKGLMKGKSCPKAAINLFTADAVIDFRGPKDTNFFKRYQPGLNGVCEFLGKSYSYDLHDLKAAMYSKGDSMVHVLNYIPGYAGKTLHMEDRITQFDVVRFNPDNSKIAEMLTFFHKPWLYDEIKEEDITAPPAPPPQMQHVDDVLGSWSGGMFEGDGCHDNADLMFTTDAVVDMRGPQRNRDFFKKYHAGLDGVCEFFKRSSDVVELKDLKISMYPRGDDVVQFLNFVPQKPGSDQTASGRVLQYFLWRFNQDKTKIKGIDSFWDNPALLDEIDDWKTPEVTRKAASELLQESTDEKQVKGAVSTLMDEIRNKQLDMTKEEKKLANKDKPVEKIPTIGEYMEQLKAMRPQKQQVRQQVGGAPIELVALGSEKIEEKKRIDIEHEKRKNLDRMKADVEAVQKTDTDMSAKQMKAAIDLLEAKQHKMKEALSALDDDAGGGKFGCKEGDQHVAFHEHRPCGNFNLAELDMPLTNWPHLTRWCKLAHRSPTVRLHQCYAQQCLASQSPTLAAKVWFHTNKRSTGESQFCQAGKYCSDHPLSHRSTLENMEAWCTETYQDQWKNFTAKDAIKLLQEHVGDPTLFGCAMGMVHCDAARCQRYFCAEDAAAQQKAAQTQLISSATEGQDWDW